MNATLNKNTKSEKKPSSELQMLGNVTYMPVINIISERTIFSKTDTFSQSG